MTPTSPETSFSENELVWQFFGGRRNGFYVEVGANEPHAGSQTWHFEERDWHGILVEPQSQLYARLRAGRPNSTVFQAACTSPGHPAETPFYLAETTLQSSLVKNRIDSGTRYVDTEMVKLLTLDELLAEAGNPKIDLISIDVEGTQLDVLLGFDLRRHHPGLLLLEDHLHNLAAHRHVTRQGYRLVKRTGLNNWYVPPDCRFTMSTRLERFRLWKKVWANTPFRKLRVFLEYRRSTRKGNGGR